MKAYIKDITRIKNELNILDNNSYDTVEEAKLSIFKYDSLLDSLIDLISNIIEEDDFSAHDKEELFVKAVSILSNYIGSAEDAQKYQSVFNNLYENKKITKTQLLLFYENLNLGRWE
jgi:hypothetical protein